MVARITPPPVAEQPPKPARRRKPAAVAAAAESASASTAAPARRQRMNVGRFRLPDALQGMHSLALTAAAQILTEQNVGDEQMNPNAQTRTWQASAWGYSRTVPELGAARMYVGNCMSRVRIKVGRRNDDGTVDDAFDGAEPVEGVDPAELAEAQKVLGTWRSGTGGQGELNRSYGEKMFIVGELYLLPQDRPWGMQFDVLSMNELGRDGTRYIRYRGPGGASEQIPPGIDPIRVYRPDPQYGLIATSSVQHCLEIAEELLILTRLVRASAISRMALAGVLAIADGFDSPDEEAGPDGQTAENTNPLLVDMINAGSKAIDDPASAAAWMPYVLQGPDDLIDKGLKFIQFAHDDAVAVVKRREALERLAHGLDLPTEIVLSHMDTTFANAGQISMDTFKVHLLPMVQMLCDALTLALLWPGMAKSKGLTPERVAEVGYPPDVTAWAVTYDASALVDHPDKAKDIVEVFTKDKTQMAIAISEVRLALDLTPDGAPDDDEVAKRLDAYTLAQRRETIQANPDDAAVPIDEVDDEGAVAPSAEHARAVKLAPGGKTTVPPPAAPTDDQGAVVASLAAMLAGAAEMSVDRAVEAAGKSIRARINGGKGPDRARIQGASNEQVASILGSAVVARWCGDSYPLDGEVAAFGKVAARMLVDGGHEHAGQAAAVAMAAVAEVAADRLYGGTSRFTVDAAERILALP